MKSIIIYYSYSGNTKKVTEILAEYLRQKGEVEEIELTGLDEAKTFLAQGKRALIHTRARIAPVVFDLSVYDLICLGTPVWAFAPAPAVNTYLDNCRGVEGKDVILFTTYGSGAGRERCLNYMQRILAKKGAKNFKRFSIQQFQVKDKEFVLAKIKETTRL
jgi:flavodoxin